MAIMTKNSIGRSTVICYRQCMKIPADCLQKCVCNNLHCCDGINMKQTHVNVASNH